MKLNFDLDTGERGVSPVIGVILMVAITVILAAVIGAFVLNLGSNLGSTGPQAQISISDASASQNSGASDVVKITHNGGDTLQASELKLTISTDSNSWSITGLQSGSWSPSSELQFKSAPGTTIGVGDSFTVTESGSSYVSSGDQVTVKIIHTGSNSIVAQATITVS